MVFPSGTHMTKAGLASISNLENECKLIKHPLSRQHEKILLIIISLVQWVHIHFISFLMRWHRTLVTGVAQHQYVKQSPPQRSELVLT